MLRSRDDAERTAQSILLPVRLHDTTIHGKHESRRVRTEKSADPPGLGRTL
ncbi:hypothetical protein GS506_20385 [Rhodococcus hoagii]|nr:hypothetical protein [Prescottella equi]